MAVLMGFVLTLFMLFGLGRLVRRKWRTTLMKKRGT